jgi:hypothetical protein
MQKVDIETSITLSRVAAHAIPFGRAVERYAAKTAKIYGGETIDDCQAAFTAGTGDTVVSVETAAFDIFEGTLPKMNRFTVTALANTGKIATNSCAATDMSGDLYVYMLIKTSVAFTTAGHLKFAIAEDALIATPRDVDVPIMAADAWYYFQLAFTGTTAERDAVISYGFRNHSGGAWTGVIDVQYLGRGNALYHPLGFVSNDQINIHGNSDASYEAAQYDDMTIIAAGHANPYLIKGATCVAGQRLYLAPKGKLATTAISSDNRPIHATEDQATAGGQVGVRL